MTKNEQENSQNDILWELVTKKDEIDLETLSTILTDSELRPEELKKLDEEKTTQKQEQKEVDWTIFDINIQTIDDLIDILLKNEYDFLAIEPNDNYVKISFKKDSILKETKNIKFPIYSNLLLQAKKISNLKLEETAQEQKWSWPHQFKDKSLELLSKTVPSSFWETLFLKVKPSEKKPEKKAQVKKWVSASQAFWFLWAILFIALILWWAFITFVIFNAQTPEDVSFFANLWINLNDINSFLLKLTTLVFSIIITIESIILIIALFKAILTKKEFKRKKTIFSVVSAILLIITFATATLWITLDKAIKSLPNWLEMSYWKIQIYDNNLLKNEEIWKNWALITQYASLIWPIELKFDVTYLQRDEERRWFKINKYIWDFGDWELKETQIPEIINTFDKKWNYKVSLTLEWIDSRFPWKITSKPASDIPELSISYLVKITEKTLDNWWKTISFNANDLKPLWEIEWYLKEDLSKPTYVWYIFQPSKIYFEQDLIWMKIKNSSSWNQMDRIFTIAWETSEIKWDITYEVSIDDDLDYTFKVLDTENSFWDWFIESFTWIIDGKEIKKEADILNLEESSTLKYLFKDYWSYDVKVILTNSNWKSSQIEEKIVTNKRIKLSNKIEIYENNTKIENIKYENKTMDYFIYDVWIPTNMDFDAKLVRSDNPLYVLEWIKWDLWWDWTIDWEWKSFNKSFEFEWTQEILVKYKFVHRRDKENTVEMVEKINLDFVEKEANLSLEIKPASEYAPTIVSFDSSLSKVRNDNIVKFIYDYGDWVVEERDAVNPGHRYLKEWNYTIKLTIVTEKWKEYSTSKSLILKSYESKASISVSMKEAPINQEIDFLSTWSMWQIIWYHWDFGDWETSSEANPSHAFKKSWTYKVKLTLDFANNNIMTEEIEIKITE